MGFVLSALTDASNIALLAFSGSISIDDSVLSADAGGGGGGGDDDVGGGGDDDDDEDEDGDDDDDEEEDDEEGGTGSKCNALAGGDGVCSCAMSWAWY
jgi:hypothetical protein